MTPNKVLAAAKKEVDAAYKEGVNNKNKFGEWYKMDHVPWCAIFVSWCFDQAKSPAVKDVQTKQGFHNCDAGLAYFRKQGQLVDVKDAQPGDIVFFNLDGVSGTSEHVGLIYVNQHEQGQMVCFEGNTGTNGSANGDGCYKKTRPLSKIAGVARPDWSKK